MISSELRNSTVSTLEGIVGISIRTTYPPPRPTKVQGRVDRDPLHHRAAAGRDLSAGCRGREAQVRGGGGEAEGQGQGAGAAGEM